MPISLRLRAVVGAFSAELYRASISASAVANAGDARGLGAVRAAMKTPLSSIPWPMIRQRQCAHVGARTWIAHSKLSKTWFLPAWLIVNALSYSLPQSSHLCMVRLLEMNPRAPPLSCKAWALRQEFGRRPAYSSPAVLLFPGKGPAMIRKLSSGEYRLYSVKTNPKTGRRRNLGTFKTLEAAKQHEREVQYFKRH